MTYCTQDQKGAFWTSLARRICAGQQLLSSLEGIRDEMSDSSIAPVVDDLAARVKSGEALFEAMKHHTDIFGTHTICFVEGGERAGILDRALMLIVEAAWRCPKCILG